MFVLEIENYKNSIRGELKRWLYEIKPGLYIGSVSTAVKNMLLLKIEKEDPTCHYAVISSNRLLEQGFSIECKNQTKYRIEEKEGLYFIVKGLKLDLSQIYNKMDKRDFRCHLYETGVVANKLMISGFLHPVIKNISNLLEIPFETLVKYITFASAFHDIGKIHPAFQFKINSETMNRLNYTYSSLYDGFRHEVYSEELFNIFCKESKLNNHLSKMLSYAIGVHHQNKKYVCAKISDEHQENVWNEMQDEAIKFIKSFIRDIKLINEDLSWINNISNGLCELFAGIINLSDWIASSDDLFKKDMSHFTDINEYKQYVSNIVNEFLASNNMLYTSLENIFKDTYINDNPYDLMWGYKEIYPLQEKILNIEVSQAPTLMIIEEGCGGAKTESAIVAATRIGKESNGFIFLMPTTTTAEPMQERIEKLIHKFFPNMTIPLFDSLAWMSEKDVALKNSHWCSNSRQKLIYPISVGTIDQALMAVQAAPYADLRLMGLAGKTVIIDEMHAYDSYMCHSICRLLNFLSLYGANIIILSATLTKDIKKDLINAFDYSGLNYSNELSEAYPLVTTSSATINGPVVNEYYVESSRNFIYPYKLHKVIGQNQTESICNIALDRMSQGGCTCVILNSIKDAQAVYDALINKYGLEYKKNCYLLHSRYTMDEKIKNVEFTIDRFGKKGKENGKRPQDGFIVVSSPIIEQSIDVDFDFLITELCPADLMLQRLGRYRRHDNKNTIREKENIEDYVDILIPIEDGNYGSSTIIYSTNKSCVVQKTQKWLQNNKDIIIPKNTREFVEFACKKENLSLIDEVKEVNDSEITLINSPIRRNKNDDFFHLYKLSRAQKLQSNFSTRYEPYKSYNVLFISNEQLDEYRNYVREKDYGRIKIFCKEIIKKQSYNSIAYWNLGDAQECVSYEEKIGLLQNYKIYLYNENTKCAMVGDKIFELDAEKGLIIQKI